jgi:hypothetical protein
VVNGQELVDFIVRFFEANIIHRTISEGAFVQHFLRENQDYMLELHFGDFVLDFVI